MNNPLRALPLVILTAWLASCDRAQPPAPANPVRDKAPAAFLERRGDGLFLGGEPFYEISFNKFDLYRQLVADELGDTKTYGPTPGERATKAVEDLARFGFKTVRVFGDVVAFTNPAKRDASLRAMERLMALARANDIRVIFCFCLSDMDLAKYLGEQAYTDIVVRKDTRSRKAVEENVTEIVSRYKDDPFIAMWETSNELLLKADIGEFVEMPEGRRRVINKLTSPSAAEVAQFHSEIRDLVRSLDKNHLFTSGDSFRTSQWHLYQFTLGRSNKMWNLDNKEQLAEVLTLTQSGVDVFGVHGYYETNPARTGMILGEDGQPIPLVPRQVADISQAAGQPLYYGEWGVLPVAKSDTGFWNRNPEWFENYEGENAALASKVTRAALALILEAAPDLTHWWTFQSDHQRWTRHPNRFDFDMERTPELVSAVAEANRQLQLSKMGFTYSKVEESKPAL
jgi:hypothetical protein